ncbi:MAG: holin [Bifidobacterium mongoliense]|jgi:hypothetical protein|uniref:holin n=1 Tax=Bifidobacterium mongoliense TaxID=518643 RepID=UPI002F350848
MTDEPNTTTIDQSEHTPAPITEPTDRGSVRHWLRATLVRAVKTAAQSALAIIPVSAVTIGGVDWLMVVGAAALSAMLSVLTSIAGIPEVADGSSLNSLATK